LTCHHLLIFVSSVPKDVDEPTNLLSSSCVLFN
jgi:hypothetical protein